MATPENNNGKNGTANGSGLTPKNTIPTGYSIEARLYPTQSIFRWNLPIGIREGMANATSYNAQNAHCLRVALEQDQKMMLVFAHDGDPFQNQDDIVYNGLLPNRSQRRGLSLQGAGMSYFSSYMEGTLIIASKTVDSGGKLEAGHAVIDHNLKEIVSSPCPHLVPDLQKYLGEAFVNKFKVFYIFMIPYFPYAGKGSKDNQNLGSDLLNCIPFICGYQWLQKIKLVVSEPVCRIQDKSNPITNVSDWLTHTEQEGSAPVKRFPAHKNRLVPSREEFYTRNCEGFWEFETKPFEIKTDQSIDTVVATIRIDAFPGPLGIKEDGSLANDGYLAAIRPSPKEWKGNKWNAMACSNEGKRPHWNGFLTAPLFYDETIKDERIKNMHERFLDNPMHMTTKIGGFLDELGIYYDADRDNEIARTHVDEKFRPYAILTVKLQKLVSRKSRFDGSVDNSPNLSCFMDALARRPDFLSGLTDNRLNEFIRAACSAGIENVPEECKKWFADRFRPPEFDAIPLSDDCPVRHSKKVDIYEYFDIDNVRNNFEFDGQFRAGSNRLFAVKARQSGDFVRDLNVTNSNPATKGVRIRTIANPSEDLIHFTNGKIRSRRYEEFKSAMGIGADDDVTLFSFSISDLGLIEDSGKFVALKKEEFLNEMSTANRCKLTPSRGVFVYSTDVGTVEKMGTVIDVPKAPKTTKAPRPPAPEGEHEKKKISGDRYCTRDQRLPVEFTHRSQSVRVNREYDIIRRSLIGVPVNSKSLELAQRLYVTIKAVVINMAEAIKTVTIDDKISRTAEEWLDASGESIFTDEYDYLINISLMKMLPQIPDVLRLVEELEKLKTTM